MGMGGAGRLGRREGLGLAKAGEGGSGKGAVRKGGWGVMKGGGVRQSRTLTQPTHLMKLGKSDVRDAMQGGHLRVGGKDPQVI